MLFSGGFTFGNFLLDAFSIFMFILWFWLIAFILFSYIGVFAYLLTQGRGMAERNQAQANEARDELRKIVGFSAADEIAKLDKLKASGSISELEYGRLRAKLVQ